MPEGDTVWRTAHHLDKALSGSVLVASDFRVPAHATAVGQAILAHLPEVAARIARDGLIGHSSRTITDPAAFISELEAIRREHIEHFLGERARVGNAGTDGWFWIYIREIHSNHDFNMDRFYASFGHILGRFPGMSAAIALGLLAVAVTGGARRMLPAGADPGVPIHGLWNRFFLGLRQ